MDITRRPSATSVRCCHLLLVAAAILLPPRMAPAQGLTGDLTVTVQNQQGDDVAGAVIILTSPALIGGPLTRNTDDKGRVRFRELPQGVYALDITFKGFPARREEAIPIRAGSNIEIRAVALNAQRVDVEAPTLLDARPGFSSYMGADYLREIPVKRVSIYDSVRAAPFISPTSPSSSVFTTVSASGSGTNETQWNIDGMNTTCPCSGVARSELGVDFIEGVHIQSVGASAEFGNMMGAVINVNTRSGSERFLSDVAYYGQAGALTAQPVRLPYLGSDRQQSGFESGFERAKYLDATATLGGPAVRERLWFFGGYQHLRDSDSQPGTDPWFPRAYETEKIFGKLTWRLSPAWHLVQSFHDEIGINPDRATIVTPFEATVNQHLSVPAGTLGHLTHTMSANTLWDVRVGRFVYTRDDTLNNGDPTKDPTKPSVFDRGTGVTSGAPARFVSPLTIKRTTGKATLTHYRPDVVGAAHEWKVGGQLERGEHDSILITPTGERYELLDGVPRQAISTPPSHIGGVSVTASAFATDTIRVGDRLTINAGVRFDHSRAISQDLQAVDLHGLETEEIVHGLGTVYTWNQWSPRLGITTNLSADGRTMLRANYGRYFQGVLTGELEAFHPGAKATTMRPYVQATGGYTGAPNIVDPKVNLRIDPDTREPRTDEYFVGVDRAIGRGLSVALAYVHKRGTDFIGWEDRAGQYYQEAKTLADGSSASVFQLDTLVTSTADRRFWLTNPDGYSLTYNGLVIAVDKRRSHGWQASGSYTLSRAYGLLPSSGASAAGPQASTVAPPQALIFGRDPNDLINARGRLANDRPHMLKVTGSADVPRTGLVIAASLQQYSGKPWAAATQLMLNQGEQRIQLEPRGSRRLSSQTLLDLRLSRSIRISGAARVELLLDVLNLLNDSAEESLATETQVTATTIIPTFGQPASFVDPRRVMFGVRLNLGR